MELNGLTLILLERTRQLNEKGWTPDHDDTHTNGELLIAATAYLFSATAACHSPKDTTFNGGFRPGEGMPVIWPFEESSWKPTGDAVRDLAKAGALIAAEIDRLQRIKKEDNKKIFQPVRLMRDFIKDDWYMIPRHLVEQFTEDLKEHNIERKYAQYKVHNGPQSLELWNKI